MVTVRNPQWCPMRVLVIEDNIDLSLNLCEFLEHKGHILDAAGDGVTGLHLITVNDYDVIVLDLSLPGLDGLEVCRQMRQVAKKSTPTLMLTGRDTLEDKLAGFNSGADDYLVKPFELLELEARVNALVNRAKNGLHGHVLQVRDLSLNLDTLEVRRGDARIVLPRVALKILELLMRETHRVVRRQELEHLLWQDDPPDSDALRTHLHGLRKAVDKPFPVQLVHTVHGIGYRLCSDDAE